MQNDWLGHQPTKPVEEGVDLVRSRALFDQFLHTAPEILGVLAAEASEQGYRHRGGAGPSPLHGYYFRILERQGPAAKGGPAEYVVGGEMTGGFALVAWPAQYDVTGVMTFVVGPDGIVFEKDLGSDTAAAAKATTRYDPDATWQRTESDR